MKRRSQVLELRLQGLTYAEMASRLGVSASRVGQILRGVPNGAREAALRARVRERAEVLRASGVWPWDPRGRPLEVWALDQEEHDDDGWDGEHSDCEEGTVGASGREDPGGEKALHSDERECGYSCPDRSWGCELNDGDDEEHDGEDRGEDLGD